MAVLNWPEKLIGVISANGFYDEKGNFLPKVAASLKTIPQGTATNVWCVTSPMLNNTEGVYCTNSDIAELSIDLTMKSDVKMYSLDEANVKRLWT